jgi:hypothetical protein
MSMRTLLVAMVAAGLLACGGPAAAPPTSTSPSGVSTSAAPTNQQWCASYGSLTSVLSQAGTDKAGATTAIASLDRFDQLWSAAEAMRIASPSEVAANRRAVASYRAVMALLSAGYALTSREVTTARADLTATTNADRELLKSSAGRVVALCGGPSATSSG